MVEAMVVVTLEATQLRAEPGATVLVAFHVANLGTKQQSVSFHVTCPDEGFDPAWCTFEAPSDLPPGARLPGEVIVRLPSSADPGRYDVMVAAVGDDETGVGAFRLAVERKPCVVLTKPRLRLNPDGSVNAQLTLINCGNVELDGSVQLRHEQGWDFQLEQPEFRLQLDAGPLDVEVTATPPEDRSAEPGRITIEIADETGVLHVREEVQLLASTAEKAPARERRAASRQDSRSARGRRALVWLALIAIVGAAVIGAALISADGDGPGEEAENGTGGAVDLGFFDAEPGDCEVFLSWDTSGPDDADVELRRDGELLYSTSTGSDGYDDSDVGEGEYAIEYELYGNGELLGTSEATGTCGAPPEPVSLEFFGVDPAGCTVFLEWETDGPDDALIELVRDGEFVYETSIGPDGYEDEDVPEGSYEFSYELLGNGDELDAQVAEGFCLS